MSKRDGYLKNPDTINIFLKNIIPLFQTIFIFIVFVVVIIIIIIRVVVIEVLGSEGLCLGLLPPASPANMQWLKNMMITAYYCGADDAELDWWPEIPLRWYRAVVVVTVNGG